MKDIAFHITDIIENSLRAGAGGVCVALELRDGIFSFSVEDDGCGMDAETMLRAADPFFTTRTERRAGLGLPLLIQSAERCGGRVALRRAESGGTAVEALFPIGHVDCPPTGDLAETLMLAITGNPTVNIAVMLSCGERSFGVSSGEIDEAVGCIGLSHPRTAAAIRAVLDTGIEEVFGRKPVI